MAAILGDGRVLGAVWRSPPALPRSEVHASRRGDRGRAELGNSLLISGKNVPKSRRGGRVWGVGCVWGLCIGAASQGLEVQDDREAWRCGMSDEDDLRGIWRVELQSKHSVTTGAGSARSERRQI